MSQNDCLSVQVSIRVIPFKIFYYILAIHSFIQQLVVIDNRQIHTTLKIKVQV